MRAFRVVFDNTDCPTNDDSMKPYVTRDAACHNGALHPRDGEKDKVRDRDR